MKSRSVVRPREQMPLADVAAGAFRHLGALGEQLAQLQVQAASIVLMESATRCAEALDGAFRGAGAFAWMPLPRAQLQNLGAPAAAWIGAATGLQAVLAAASMQAFAMLVFPAAAPVADIGFEDRRVDSVVIPFPDRRRGVR